jgi:hypothetical protein
MFQNGDTTLQEISESTMIRYLLGELEEEEQARLEERLFTDRHYDQLLAVEDDLIEAYARGELSASQREHFEEHYLQTSDRRERVALAQDLAAILAEEERRGRWRRSLLEWLRTPIAQVSFATVTALLFVLGGVWLLNWRAQVNEERAALQRQQQQSQQQLAEREAQIAQLKAELEEERRQGALTAPTPEQVTIFAFTLSPFAGRGSAGEAQTIPAGVDQARIRLDLEQAASHRDYEAEVKRVSDSQVVIESLRNVRPTASGRAVIASFSVKTLKEGDYILALKGRTAESKLETIAEYQFAIAKN